MAPNLTVLEDRGVIAVTGRDAATLLDGLVTNSLSRLGDSGAIHTGLLSPQGKILFDFFLFRTADGFLIDVARDAVADFMKRLTFYRLRADVTFTDRSDSLVVAALWPEGASVPGGVIAAPDPRNPHLGLRLILPPARMPEIPAESVDRHAYDAHRIALGIPDAGRDYELADAFPHEALYDQLGSVDFKKGCFIGQEVVSRMQHRGTARKRAVRVRISEPVEPGTEVKAGDATIGAIGSAGPETAIALLRLDRAGEAKTAGTPLTAGPATVEIDLPEWLHLDPATGKAHA
jgi:folate-binding protein YgfZ